MCVGQLYFFIALCCSYHGQRYELYMGRENLFYVCAAERPIMDEMKRILIKSKNGRKCLNQ